MKNKRIPFVPALVLVSGLLLAWPALAIGFVSATSATELGRRLDFRAVVGLDDGAPLEAECVRAGVTLGDRALPAQGVASIVTTGPRDTAVVRVRTEQRVDEPIVTVDLEVGCTQRVARRFTVFADPPAIETAVAPAALAQADAVSAAPAAAVPAPTAGREAPTPKALPAALAPLRPRPAGANAAASTARPVPSAEPVPDTRPARKRARPRAQPVAPAPELASRLRLDAPLAAASASALPAPAPAEATLALVDQANEAVQAAIAAASASQSRIAALEAGVRQLGAAAHEQRALIEQLQSRAAGAERESRWFWPLLLVAAVLAALSGWLWSRLRELERERRRGWLAAAQSGDAAQAVGSNESARRSPSPPSQVPLLVERGPRPRGEIGSLGAGLAPVHEPEPSDLADTRPAQSPHWHDELASQRTQPLLGPAPARSPAAAPPDDAPARDVSADELIDLEQQAEFFVVLGQDEAAIDLLMAHLRDSGGSSPLPYLKLLEIYRRRTEREAYERTRERFNQRFNAHAPAWDAAGGEGRALEAYPQVVAWLQRVWPQPLDAMAELESLLFRRDGGDLFELPAYRELLMLYGVAHELLDDRSGGGHAVDVLLPLNDANAFMQTSPRPYFGDETRAIEVQPTAPLDLDLDDGASQRR